MKKRWGERVIDAFLGGPVGNEKNKLGWFLTFAVSVFAVAFVGLGLVWWKDGQQTAGPLGDFFGGMLNPILSFLAFAGVLYSIHLQRLDLRETQKEAARQQFESTFFQMLAQMNRIVEAMDIKKFSIAYSGRDCFAAFADEIERQYEESAKSSGGSVQRGVAAAYRVFWQQRRQDLGHYFRFLYNCVRYVDEADLPQLPGDVAEPKTKYMRILRSQLSDYELVLMFYNAHGGHGANFNPYVGKYNLLDNLQPELVRIVDAIELREGLGRIGSLPVRSAL